MKAHATLIAALLSTFTPDGAACGQSVISSRTISLDGEWLLATDAKNVGRQERWFEKARPEAKRTKVPWIIQDAFPGYHGVAWYWRDFQAPANPHASGKYLRQEALRPGIRAGGERARTRLSALSRRRGPPCSSAFG